MGAENIIQIQGAIYACLACLRSVYSPKNLEKLLLNGGLANQALVRENRLRFGVETKLAKELTCARLQMEQEIDKAFVYQEGDLGHAERERVGSYDVGICHFIGRRDAMEDEHLSTAFEIRINGKMYPVQLFGIFDGHGGSETSKFLKANLKETLEQSLKEFGVSEDGIWNALKITFVRLNEQFVGSAGSTATVALFLDGHLWTANVGDSRTILDNRGQQIQLSEDAKPGDARYQRGIKNRGGWVEYLEIPRVNGCLGVARAIGDHELNGAVSARPKITKIPIKKIKPGSHLILTCDGVYDVASTRQIGRAVHENRNLNPMELAKNIVYSAFHAGSNDNLSAMVIKIR